MSFGRFIYLCEEQDFLGKLWIRIIRDEQMSISTSFPALSILLFNSVHFLNKTLPRDTVPAQCKVLCGTTIMDSFYYCLEDHRDSQNYANVLGMLYFVEIA